MKLSCFKSTNKNKKYESFSCQRKSFGNGNFQGALFFEKEISI